MAVTSVLMGDNKRVTQLLKSVCSRRSVEEKNGKLSPATNLKYKKFKSFVMEKTCTSVINYRYTYNCTNHVYYLAAVVI